VLRLYCLEDRQAAAGTPKRKPRPFSRTELSRTVQFLYSVLIAFPPPIQNISTALFRLHTIVVMCRAGTGKTPSEGRYRQATDLNIENNCLCVHSMRATIATTALSHDADIAKVQEWLGHANVSTTRLYDRRRTRPEDSPTFRVRLKHPSQCLRSRGGMGSFPGGTVSESRQCPSRP